MKRIIKKSIFAVLFLFIFYKVSVYVITKIWESSLEPKFAIETFSLNQVPKFKTLIGREYLTQVDLIVFKYDWDPDYFRVDAYDKDYPPINEIKKFRTVPLRHNLSCLLYGLLAKGNKIKVVDVLRKRVIKLGKVGSTSDPKMQGEILAPGDFQGYKVLLDGLTNLKYGIDDDNIDTTHILEKFAVLTNEKK